MANVLGAIPRHDILSLSGHTVYEPLRPDRSGFILAHPTETDANGRALPDLLSVAALRLAQFAVRDGPAPHAGGAAPRALGMASAAERSAVERAAASLPAPGAAVWWAGFRIIGG